MVLRVQEGLTSVGAPHTPCVCGFVRPSAPSVASAGADEIQDELDALLSSPSSSLVGVEASDGCGVQGDRSLLAAKIRQLPDHNETRGLRVLFAALRDTVHEGTVDQNPRWCLCQEAQASAFVRSLGQEKEGGGDESAELFLQTLLDAADEEEGIKAELAAVCELSRAMFRLRQADEGVMDHGVEKEHDDDYVGVEVADAARRSYRLLNRSAKTSTEDPPSFSVIFDSPAMALECIRVLLPIVLKTLLAPGDADTRESRPSRAPPDPVDDARDADEDLLTDNSEDSTDLRARDEAAVMSEIIEEDPSEDLFARVATFRVVVSALSCGPLVGTAADRAGDWMRQGIRIVLFHAREAIRNSSLRKELSVSVAGDTDLAPSIADLILLARLFSDRAFNNSFGVTLLERALASPENAGLLFRMASSQDLLHIFMLLPHQDQAQRTAASSATILHKAVMALVTLCATSVISANALGHLLDAMFFHLTSFETPLRLRFSAARTFEQTSLVATESFAGCAELLSMLTCRVQVYLEEIFRVSRLMDSGAGAACAGAIARGLCSLCLCEAAHESCRETDACIWKDVLEAAELEEFSLDNVRDRPIGDEPGDGVKAHLLACALLVMNQSLRSRMQKPSDRLRPHLAELFADTKAVLVSAAESCFRWCSRVDVVRSLFHALDSVTEATALDATGAQRVLTSLKWFSFELALSSIEDMLDISMTFSKGPGEGDSYGYDLPQNLEIDEAMAALLPPILNRYIADASIEGADPLPRERAVLERIVAGFARSVHICEMLCGAFRNRPDLFRAPYPPSQLDARREIALDDEGGVATNLDASQILFDAATALNNFSKRLCLNLL